MKNFIGSLTVVLFLLVACDQGGLSVQYGITNVLRAPLDVLKSGTNLITGNTYNNLKEKSAGVKKEEKMIQCEVGEHKDENLNDLKMLAAVLNKDGCSCQAWGTCTKEKCSCDKLCPWSFALFNKGDVIEMRDYSDTANSLTFLNTPSAFKNHKMAGGYCTGHAAMTQRFHRLAFFDSKKKAPYDISSKDLGEQAKAVKYYKALISKVAANEVAEIPGFKNLEELSDHPAMQEYIADEIAHLWANLNNGIGKWIDNGIQTTKTISNDGVTKRFSDLKQRLDNNQQPLINIVGENGDFHTLLLSHYKVQKDGTIEYCTNDPNEIPRANHGCFNKFTLDKDNKISYSPWSTKIKNIDLHPTEESGTVEQINSLQRHCKSKKDC